MPRLSHRQRLIRQYPSLINGDPNFRTSGHSYLGKNILCRRPKNLNISGHTNTTTGRQKGGVKGTIIGFLSESDVDESGNAAFVATKTSQYSRKGDPSKLFHIVLDEKDKDNDPVVVDLEEWEIDEYCEWIAVDQERRENIGKEQKNQMSSSSRVQGCDDTKSNKTTEFEMLSNLALEAATSVSHVPAVVETSTAGNTNDGQATLAKAAAAGCTKCRKELDGKTARGPHVGHCPRKYPRKRDEESIIGCKGLKGRDHTDTSNKAIDSSCSRKSVGELGENDNIRDNTVNQSRKKTIDSSSIGEKVGSNNKCDKNRESVTQSNKKKKNSSGSEEKLDSSDKCCDKRVKRKGNVVTQSTKKKNDSGSRGNCKNSEGRSNQDQAHALAIKPCPSFNDILKSALASYSSNTRQKNTKNSLPPVPPPFLSHEENCTIRTALAFVMAKAKNKERGNRTSLPSRITPEAEENTTGRVSADRLGGAMQTNGSNSQGRSPLVGGLLALPPRECAPIGQMNLNASNAMIVLERELKHVRDVMNLAVSALLPLYKSSTLNVMPVQRPSEDRQKQCAVYDYESAAKPSSERHLASFDGLCRHIVGRISSLVNDEALRRKLANESSATMPKGTSHADQMELSINADDYVSEEEAKKDIVCDAVAQLQMDLITDSFSHSSNPVQQIHQIMASCHVLHRLLLLDENCTNIGSDCVAMACTLLTDLYNDKCIGGTNDRGSSQFRQLEGFEEQSDKEKHQVVPSRWSYTNSSYIANREERCMQAVSAMSQPCNPSGPPLKGMKRSSNPSQYESNDYQPMQLPRLGDVLAVNLLRLLEGASAIRLHFHRRYTGQNSGFTARKVATSAAAAEVLQEIRSKTDDVLLIPIHINDAASLYYHETLGTRERRVGKVEHLRPGAKMMLRIHLFGLIQKLSLYEQMN